MGIAMTSASSTTMGSSDPFAHTVPQAVGVAVPSSAPRFDPNTGQPIQQPAGGGARFDPNTGQPIPKFDPETGKQNWV